LLHARRNLGQPADWSGGDFDYDGRVTARDWVMVRRNLGLTLPDGTITLAAAGANQTVPEPSLGLLAVAPLFMPRRRRPVGQVGRR
jgi:hypothetical protein